MAIGQISYTPGFIRTKIGNNSPTYQNRNIQMRYQWVPDKTKGIWISLPNGTKFRKATALMKFRRWLEFGAAQYTDSKINTSNVHVDTNPGGYFPDVWMTSSGTSLKSSIGSLSKFDSTPSIPSSMRNEATTKALLDIADQKAGIGEDLATFRQTQRMLASPASSLLGGLQAMARDKAMRKYLTRSYHDLLKHGVSRKIAEKYLEYIYGFKPLMNDIYGIIAVMKERGNKTLLLSGEGTSVQQCQPVAAPYNGVNTWSELVEITEEATVHCKIWGRIDPDSAGLRTLNSLGLLNPISLTWELIPWSFVVDWFLPIGSVLQALTAPAGLIFVDGSVSVRNNLTGIYEYRYTYYDSKATVNNNAGGSIQYEGYKRETLGTWPIPGFWASTNPFRGDRPFKALALAITNLPKELRF